jgi:hypothetical protein
MTLTVEQLRHLPEPYATLCTGDALSEHRDELNQLTPEEMHDLATRLILACPKEDLGDFGHAIEALRRPHDDKTSFHAVLMEAYEVKKRLLSLVDVKNKKPYLLFLEPEFDEELFYNFNGLAIQILADNESNIAEKLALLTPENKRSELEQNLQNQFPDSLFTTKVGHAFAVRRDIDRLLLGDEPYQFFASREFSVDAVIEFKGLFQLINGNESIIAGKLALSTPEAYRSKVAQNINSLAPTGELSQKIRTAFELRRNIDQMLLGTKPELFFERRQGFNEGICLEFPMLFPALLTGKEQDIGEKLAQVADSKVRSDIAQKLERINNAAHDQNNTLRKIASAMTTPKQAIPRKQVAPSLVLSSPSEAKQGEISDTTPSSSDNRRYALFNDQLQKQTPAEKPIAKKDANSTCCDSFCGLFS